MNTNSKHIYLIVISIYTLLHCGCKESTNPPKQNQKIDTFRPFITTWHGNTITIPCGKGDFLYDVDWNNDGVYDDLKITKSITHHYKDKGTRFIRIRGKFPHFSLDFNRDTAKQLRTVEQWGDIEWKSMNRMFNRAEHLTIPAKDAPNLKAVKDMSYMFYLAKAFNQPIDHWDVSNVENMSSMFHRAASFNQSLNRWNVSNVKTIDHMFYSARAYNQSMSQWDTSNMTNMSRAFSNTGTFNQSLDTWNTSKVETLRSMFDGAIRFDHPLGSWRLNKLKSKLTIPRAMSQKNYEYSLEQWATHGIKNVTIHASIRLIDGKTITKTYCKAKPFRTKLIEELNWTIKGDMEHCTPPIKKKGVTL